MYDSIDDFNSNLANQVTLWVALNKVMPNNIHGGSIKFKGLRRRNESLWGQQASLIVEGIVHYPSIAQD
jgi:hypothetical protein